MTLVAVAGAGVVSVGLLVYEFADGGATYGSGGIAEACAAGPSYPGSGAQAEAQRLIESALYSTACTLAEPISDVVEALSGVSPPSALRERIENRWQEELSSLTAGLPPALTIAIDQALERTPLGVRSSPG